MIDTSKVQDLDSEMATLGAMMVNKEIIDDVAAIITHVDAFYTPQHRLIYSALVAMHAEGKPIDLLLTVDHLRATGKLLEVGDVEYMVQLSESFGDWANAGHYAQIVQAMYVRRRVMSIAESLACKASDPLNEPDMEACLSLAWRELEEVDSRTRESGVVDLHDILPNLPSFLANQSRSCIPTGFDSIDQTIGGLHRPGYIVIAARPSLGKTSLAVQFVLNVAMQAGVPSLFCSLETPTMRLAGRALAIESATPLGVHRSGPPDNFTAAVSAFRRKLGLGKIFLTDAVYGIGQLAALVRSCVRRKKIGLVVVDYLQLLSGDQKSENRNAEIQRVSRVLRMLANQQQVAVLALCQLNREAAASNRPSLHHLRESGAIEQDADMVAFLYGSGATGMVCFDVAKNRDGPRGCWNMEFKAALTTFECKGVWQEEEPSAPTYAKSDVSPSRKDYVPF
jgi:replicative DNA helicase